VTAEPIGRIRLVEVVGRAACHPDPFHDPARPDILRNRKRYNFLESRLAKRKCQRRPGRFGRIAAPPMLSGEAPADLDTRREVGVEARHGEADETREWYGVRDFYRSQAEPVPVEMPIDEFRERVALGAPENRRQVFHDPRIGIQNRKRRAIGRKPPPQDQPFRTKLARHDHSERPQRRSSTLIRRPFS
jgi:hypothetical protein